MSGHEKKLGWYSSRPIPASLRAECGLYQAAARLGRDVSCPVKDFRCDRCAYHTDCSFDNQIEKRMPKRSQEQRDYIRNYMRKWQAEHRSGRPVGKPARVPKKDLPPGWKAVYACVYARFERAIVALPAVARPAMPLDLLYTLHELGVLKSQEIPSCIDVADAAGEVWRLDCSVTPHTLVCTSAVLRAENKIIKHHEQTRESS